MFFSYDGVPVGESVTHHLGEYSDRSQLSSISVLYLLSAVSLVNDFFRTTRIENTTSQISGVVLTSARAVSLPQTYSHDFHCGPFGWPRATQKGLYDSIGVPCYKAAETCPSSRVRYYPYRDFQ